MNFTPVDDFKSEELQSEYCKGLIYTVRPGNTKLEDLVRKWIGEGKVQLVSGSATLAASGTAASGTVSGVGEVKDAPAAKPAPKAPDAKKEAPK